MFGRSVITKIVPITSKILKAAQISSQSQNAPILRIVLNSQLPNVRQYVQETVPENMLTDYDYVKKATTNKDILIVDVREPEEIKEHGQIPNSINISLRNVANVLSTMTEKEFQETYNRPMPKENTEIIFYCTIGKRSGMAQQNAFNIGFKKCINKKLDGF